MSEKIKSTRPENVRSSIALMQRVIDEERGFSIVCWVYDQGDCKKNPEIASPDEEEATSCGMVACYGGWLAMSKEFRSAGGTNTKSWAPSIINGEGLVLENADAVAHWLGVPLLEAQNIVGIGPSNVMMSTDSDDEDSLEEFSTFYGCFLDDATPEHVVSALQDLL